MNGKSMLEGPLFLGGFLVPTSCLLDLSADSFVLSKEPARPGDDVLPGSQRLSGRSRSGRHFCQPMFRSATSCYPMTRAMSSIVFWRNIVRGSLNPFSWEVACSYSLVPASVSFVPRAERSGNCTLSCRSRSQYGPCYSIRGVRRKSGDGINPGVAQTDTAKLAQPPSA
jgi:hypothetical protein